MAGHAQVAEKSYPVTLGRAVVTACPGATNAVYHSSGSDSHPHASMFQEQELWYGSTGIALAAAPTQAARRFR
jgi:hypothetical protein